MPYKLFIEQVMTDLYGLTRFGKWVAEVSDEEFEEIKKDPRQDYTNFGGLSIDYTRIEAYRKEMFDHKDYIEIREYKEPIIIEEGEADLDAEEEEWFTEIPFEPIHA